MRAAAGAPRSRSARAVVGLPSQAASPTRSSTARPPLSHTCGPSWSLSWRRPPCFVRPGQTVRVQRSRRILPLRSFPSATFEAGRRICHTRSGQDSDAMCSWIDHFVPRSGRKSPLPRNPRPSPPVRRRTVRIRPRIGSVQAHWSPFQTLVEPPYDSITFGGQPAFRLGTMIKRHEPRAARAYNAHQRRLGTTEPALLPTTTSAASRACAVSDQGVEPAAHRGDHDSTPAGS